MSSHLITHHFILLFFIPVFIVHNKSSVKFLHLFIGAKIDLIDTLGYTGGMDLNTRAKILDLIIFLKSIKWRTVSLLTN